MFLIQLDPSQQTVIEPIYSKEANNINQTVHGSLSLQKQVTL